MFTADPDRGLAVAGRVRTGTFGINQGYTMDPFAPFGGVKASRYGRELGTEGIDSYTVVKSISVAAGRWNNHVRHMSTVRRPLGDLQMRYRR